jgi:hypothetical protein
MDFIGKEKEIDANFPRLDATILKELFSKFPNMFLHIPLKDKEDRTHDSIDMRFVPEENKLILGRPKIPEERFYSCLPYIQILKTKSNFDGERMWFACPAFKKDKSGDRCGKRVRVLFFNFFFGCRECHNLIYKSTTRSRLEKMFNLITLEENRKLDILQKSITRKYYQGKLTKKYEKLLRKRSEQDAIEIHAYNMVALERSDYLKYKRKYFKY